MAKFVLPRKQPKELDEGIIRRMASVMCTNEDIAFALGCCADTLERRYRDIIYAGKAEARASLRRKQWEVAESGNVTMLIWLGKQWLKQREPEREIEQEKHIEEIKVTLHPSLITNAA